MSSWAYFSPNGGCQDAIISGLSVASNTVKGLLFMYQNELIHNQLLSILGDGISVTLIFDRRQQFVANPRILELIAAGAVCYWDKVEKSVRSQYLIVDEGLIFTGSYLYSYTSELRYAENLLVSDDVELSTPYCDNFAYHLAHSELIV
jgi:hypothetical protein